MGLLSSYDGYKKAYKNYRKVMMDLISKKEHIKIVSQDGKSSFWNRQKTYLYMLYVDNDLHNGNLDFFTFENSVIPGCMNFKYKSGQLFMCGMETNHNFLSTFGADEYAFLNVSGENVIDIGSNVGDSPIYFTLNESKIVIAVPNTGFYETMSKNIKGNDLENRITVVNAGYTGSKRLVSLKDIFEKYKLDSAVLKIDDDAAVEKFLTEDDETVNKLKRIQILYHGSQDKLKEKLEKDGFKITTMKRKIKSFVNDGEFICAEK